MSAKELRFSEAARSAILNGVNTLADVDAALAKLRAIAGA